jgi:ATP-dependent RNA helicase DeaD
MKTFEELGLSREFVSILEEEGIKIPSEIQEKTIPLVLAGKDVVGGSATGSGKTLAFASGIIENLERDERVQALILTPTRELAEQVAKTIRNFSYHKKLNVLPVYGGVNIENQIRRLRNTDVVVGTPGRILDHLKRGTLRLDKIKFLVLDEVDRMFDMGFKNDVELILNQCPKKRQTMLFSATITAGIEPLAQKHTKNPVEVSVESHVDASKLKQVYYDVPDGLKFSLFVHLLKREKIDLVMVFCGTRRNVDFVANNLINLGIRAKAIHGGLNQTKRSKVLQEFNGKGGVNVLVCTDVAARGLDIPAVSHVYNYDLPKISDDYIHRIGRTARAGKEGVAISILASRDYDNFNNILRDEKLKIEQVELPRVERVNIIAETRSRDSSDSRRRDPSRGRSDGRRREGGRGPSRGGSSSGGRYGSKRPSSGGRSYSRGSSGGRSYSRGSSSRDGGSSSEGERKSYGRRGPSKGNVKRNRSGGQRRRR